MLPNSPRAFFYSLLKRPGEAVNCISNYLRQVGTCENGKSHRLQHFNDQMKYNFD